MKKKSLLFGLILILIALWFYTSLSTFKIEEKSSPKRLILREGTIRTDTEVAEALSKELDFDLEGAYKSGYTAFDVVEYLIESPHKLSITFYDGRFYEGRRTVLRIIPLGISILLLIIGIIKVLLSFGKKKPDQESQPPTP